MSALLDWISKVPKHEEGGMTARMHESADLVGDQQLSSSSPSGDGVLDRDASLAMAEHDQ